MGRKVKWGDGVVISRMVNGAAAAAAAADDDDEDEDDDDGDVDFDENDVTDDGYDE